MIDEFVVHSMTVGEPPLTSYRPSESGEFCLGGRRIARLRSTRWRRFEPTTSRRNLHQDSCAADERTSPAPRRSPSVAHDPACSVRASGGSRLQWRGPGVQDGLPLTPLWSSHITFMALSRKKATTTALDPEDDRLLSRAARERGVSRSEFVRTAPRPRTRAVPPASQA